MIAPPTLSGGPTISETEDRRKPITALVKRRGEPAILEITTTGLASDNPVGSILEVILDVKSLLMPGHSPDCPGLGTVAPPARFSMLQSPWLLSIMPRYRRTRLLIPLRPGRT